MKFNDQESIREYSERIAVRFAIAIGSLILITVIIANWGRNPVPMYGDPYAWGSICLTLIHPFVSISTFIAFILGVKKWNSLAPKNRQRSWYLPSLPLAATTGVLAAILIEFGIRLIENAFKDLSLAMLQGAIIAAAAGAVVSYALIKTIMNITTIKMLMILSVTLVIGVYITAVEIADPYWWRVSLSYLGTQDSSSRDIFNHTLKLGGILLISWVPLFLNDFRILERGEQLAKHSYSIVKYALLLLGVAVFNIGMFPSRESDFDSFMHNISAYSLCGIVAVLMVGSKWLFPKFPKEFYTISAILLAILLTTLFFAAIGYVNTVGLELIGFTLAFSWLFQFIGNVERTAEKLEPEGFPG